MARYSQLCLFAPTGWSGSPGRSHVDITFGTTAVRFTPAPIGTTTATAVTGGWLFPPTWNGLAATLQLALAQLGLDERLTVETGTATAPTVGNLSGVAQWPRITIRATDLADNYPFVAPSITGLFGGNGVYGGLLAQIPPPAIDADVLGCQCFGQTAGSILLTLSGGVAPYTVAWADGGSTALSRLNLPAGDYTVSVSDSAVPVPYFIEGSPTQPRGYSYAIGGGEVQGVRSRTITVVEPPRPQLLITRLDGIVTVSITGGTPPYTYAWSDGGTGAVRANLVPGTYTLTITDAQGCVSAASVVVPPFERYWSRNPITLRTDAGDAYRLDPTTKPGLTFTVEVWLEEDYRSGTFVQIGSVLEQPADRTGRSLFQVQELLDPWLEWFVPSVAQQGLVRATPLFRRFYLKYREVYGTPPTPAVATTITQHVVVRGGLSFAEFRARTWFDTYQERRKVFLTWQPNNKPARRDQPEFLCFQPLEDYGTLQLRRRVYLANGTSAVATVATISGVYCYEVYCAAVGFAALSLGAQPARVLAWEVWLTTAGGAAVSEVRRYELDERPVWQCRYFLFANSLGGIDTLVATGRAGQEAAVTGDDLALTLAPDYEVLAGDTAALERELTPVLKVATGLRSRAELLALQDFLVSRRVLLVEGGRLLAGTVRAKSVPVIDDENGRGGLDFEFVLPRERNYTPWLPPTPTDLEIAYQEEPDEL